MPFHLVASTREKLKPFLQPSPKQKTRKSCKRRRVNCSLSAKEYETLSQHAQTVSIPPARLLKEMAFASRHALSREESQFAREALTLIRQVQTLLERIRERGVLTRLWSWALFSSLKRTIKTLDAKLTGLLSQAA